MTVREKKTYDDMMNLPKSLDGEDMLTGQERGV